MIRYKNSKNKHMASVSWKYICIKHIKIRDFYCEKFNIFQHVKIPQKFAEFLGHVKILIFTAANQRFASIENLWFSNVLIFTVCKT